MLSVIYPLTQHIMYLQSLKAQARDDHFAPSFAPIRQECAKLCPLQFTTVWRTVAFNIRRWYEIVPTPHLRQPYLRRECALGTGTLVQPIRGQNGIRGTPEARGQGPWGPFSGPKSRRQGPKFPSAGSEDFRARPKSRPNQNNLCTLSWAGSPKSEGGFVNPENVTCVARPR